MSKLRSIPSNAKEIQEGLWLEESEVIILGNTYTKRRLYSSDGYCFYSKARINEGDKITRDKCASRATLSFEADINDYISIKIEDLYVEPEEIEEEIANEEE